MVSSLLAALLALVTTAFALATPQASPDPAGISDEGSNLGQEAGNLGESIRQLVREAAGKALADTPSVEPTGQPGRSQAPLQPSPPTPDGCTRDESSGEGWSRTSVRCVQHSEGGNSSSVSVSSSSSVTVQESSSDAMPEP